VHEDLLCAALGVASSSEIIDAEDNPTPYLGLTAIIIGATKRLPSLTDQERVGLEDELGDVASNLGQCERILRQPIPLGYERSTVRFLWMWLLLLPFALVPTFADMGWPQETWSSLVIGTVTFLSVVFLCVDLVRVRARARVRVRVRVKVRVSTWLGLGSYQEDRPSPSPNPNPNQVRRRHRRADRATFRNIAP
jgi:hypothetical protein